MRMYAPVKVYPKGYTKSANEYWEVWYQWVDQDGNDVPGATKVIMRTFDEDQARAEARYLYEMGEDWLIKRNLYGEEFCNYFCEVYCYNFNIDGRSYL